MSVIYPDNYPIFSGPLGYTQVPTIDYIRNIRKSYFTTSDQTTQDKYIFFRKVAREYSLDILNALDFLKKGIPGRNRQAELDQVLNQTLFENETIQYRRWLEAGQPVVQDDQDDGVYIGVNDVVKINYPSELGKIRHLYLDNNPYVGGSDARAYFMYNMVYDNMRPDIKKVLEALDSIPGRGSFVYANANAGDKEKIIIGFLAANLTEAELNGFLHWFKSETTRSTDSFRLAQLVAGAGALVLGGYIAAGVIGAGSTTGALAGQTGLLTGEGVAAAGTIGLEAGSTAGIIGGGGMLGGEIAAVVGGATTATTVLEQIINAGTSTAAQVGAAVIDHAKEIVIGEVISEVVGDKSPSSQPPAVSPVASFPTQTKDINDFLNKNKDKIGLGLTVLAGLAALM